MPIYEYQCQACGKHFEEMQKVSDEPLKICPNCNKPELKKLVSHTSFQLKGGGYYATDYKKPSESKSSSESSTKESESKAAATSSAKETTTTKKGDN